MAKKVFSLRDVYADEADDVRALLQDNNIACYETSGGNWGVSVPAIWCFNDSDYQRARELIENYQQRRIEQLAEAGRESKVGRDGVWPQGKPWLQNTLRDLIDNPLRFVFMLTLAGGILYISVQPFFHYF